ncbi:MAG: hypothetical protein A3F67_06770 [Verrucomicrobia bacterium RIFCSPHIGHO2_12_FULL_41_10]|nr:MAG: hypothetical protein A3F67_06770 [Verrucomicrobia bacterium RIFCSPHIGHO2_12_FULL_41_10]HLB33272.1 hypothetical protein [Chthoniobacterales bacterium]
MKNKEHQLIKDPETEAKELENILRDVGQSLREASTNRGKSGLTYAQFEERFLKKLTKTTTPSHA